MVSLQPSYISRPNENSDTTNTGSRYLPFHSQASIHDLPLEILAEIFILSSAFDILAPRAHFRAVVSSSQVCSLWRKTSLAYPKIWAQCMDLGFSDEWVDEIVSRSKTEPLDFVIPSATATLEDHNATLSAPTDLYSLIYRATHSTTLCEKQHYLSSHLQARSLLFERCGRLFLSLHAGQWEGYYRRVVKEYFPTMKTIAITRCRTSSNDTHDFMRLLEAEELHAYRPWKVEILKLDSCLLPLHVPVFRSIRELDVSGSRRGTMKPEAWLNAFRNMPELRILVLSFAYAAFGSPVRLPPSRHIHIPLLSRFRITGHVADLLELMHNISYPTDTCEATIRIRVNAVDDLFDNLCKLLAERYNSYAPNVQLIQISSIAKGLFIWLATRDTGMPKLTVILLRPEAVMQSTNYKWPGSRDPLVILLNAFKDHCGMAEVLRLDIIDLSDFPGSQIFHLFTNTWKLHIARLTRRSLQALRPLVLALADDNAEIDHSANLHLLPLLQRITYLKRDSRIPAQAWKVTRPGISMISVAQLRELTVL